MSQAGSNSSSSGPPPPAVPVQFNTDVNSPAIPAANILIEIGGSTNVNNTNGIITDGSSGGNTLTVQLTNRSSVSSTTVGAVTTSVSVLTTQNGHSYSFRVLVSGFDSANNKMTGGEVVGSARTAGGIVTVVGTNDTFNEEDASLVATDYDVTGSGADLQVFFTGVAGTNITWSALFQYIQS